ncbi:MAG: hypothetical protein UR20_C0005G0012 [Candidatus Woesebacteria bacterium GW2011_GWE2_31_6]|nr:MAG: hypothetical protein UR20_C0005G0012 [Candidatus Woesebacteria bacterium GW2011_GWE2_31_6]
MPEEEVKIVGLSKEKVGGKVNFKIIFAIIGIVVLALGIVAGIILVREQQNISEDAQTCNEECPSADGVLRNCHPPNSNGSAQESVCSSSGLVAFCGSRNYCCPSAGAPWTTNLTLCATEAPTPTETATATTTSTGSGSPTSTTSTGSGSASVTPTGFSRATPTAIASGTSAPIPVTGASWPTILGAGVGIIVVLTSLLLAL